MSTKFTEDCVAVLNVAMPAAERKAKAAGRVLQPSERAMVAQLVRESLSGNLEALAALQVWTGAPAAPAKPAAPAIGETTDLGRALLEGNGHRSPFFFSKNAPRTAKEIIESAGNFSPETSKLADQLPAFRRDEIKTQAVLDLARAVSFGGRRLDD
jgi:hypothetical protein